MNPADATRVGDPRPARSRARLVQAATTHLLEHGYALTSLEAVAAEAGLAKRTIYNLFSGKEELFRAVIEHSTETAERFSETVVLGVPEAGDEAGDEAAAIRRLAVDHARAVLNPRVVGLRRLLIGESARFPELAADYYRRAPDRVMRALAVRFGRSAARGSLVIPPGGETAAAGHFAFLVIGPSLDRALFSAAPLDAKEVDAVALTGAEVFLRAYAAAARPVSPG